VDDSEEAKQMREKKQREAEEKRKEAELVPADVIKEKYGVDMGSLLGGNMKFSKDAADTLISHATTYQSPEVSKKKDFKFYNNSYIYVSFRKEALQKETSNKLAVRLIKNTKQDIRQRFYEESATHNNETRYELLRKLKREIEKNETDKNPRAKDSGNVPEPEMDVEEQLRFAEEESRFIKEHEHKMWLRDLDLLENNITYSPVNVTMTIGLTKLYKSYCIFNISDKLTIKASHRKVAKVLIQDPTVLAVEFLANQTEFGTKASIEEMNVHKKKVVR